MSNPSILVVVAALAVLLIVTFFLVPRTRRFTVDFCWDTRT